MMRTRFICVECQCVVLEILDPGDGDNGEVTVICRKCDDKMRAELAMMRRGSWAGEQLWPVKQQ